MSAVDRHPLGVMFQTNREIARDPECPICSETVTDRQPRVDFWIAARWWLGRMHERCIPPAGFEDWADRMDYEAK